MVHFSGYISQETSGDRQVFEKVQSRVCGYSFEVSGFGTHDEHVPFVVGIEIVASALPVAGDGKERRGDGFRRHDAGSIRERLRVNPVLQADSQILRLVVNGPVGCVLQLHAENQRVVLLEAPHVTDADRKSS